MFAAFKRSLPEISIFHNPSSPPSTKALGLLRASLSGPFPASKANSPPLYFNLEVIESPPTPDQLRTIVSFLPPNKPSKPSSVFLSAHPSASASSNYADDVSQIAKLATQNPNTFKWPVVVDWASGRASIGDVGGVESILEELRKKRDGESKEEDEFKPKGWFS
ncbi:hypothetical protein HGRIS_007093 [Hohenbuehelia grisea]|uniref:Thioredoxin-like protein n=1 Tax=Hohenbuehelia grisea TaxID=104357 RepID=A0ABR3JB50_9AGAR